MKRDDCSGTLFVGMAGVSARAKVRGENRQCG